MFVAAYVWLLSVFAFPAQVFDIGLSLSLSFSLSHCLSLSIPPSLNVSLSLITFVAVISSS